MIKIYARKERELELAEFLAVEFSQGVRAFLNYPLKDKGGRVRTRKVRGTKLWRIEYR